MNNILRTEGTHDKSNMDNILRTEGAVKKTRNYMIDKEKKIINGGKAHF